MMTPRTLSEADNAQLRSLHPDCPDWQRLGPTSQDAAIRAAAMAATVAAEERDSQWSGGFNRRTFLAGGLGVGVAALGAQLVTSRVSYAAAAEPGESDATGTLVVIFLRGGMDGLSLLVPAGDPNLAGLRPGIGIPASSLLDFGTDRGFGLHPALAPLQALISAGRVAAVPAVSTPDLSRSHFQAQDCLERGSTNSLTTGWLDRVLSVSGAGTTFRSVAVGGLLPRSLMGTSGAIGMRSLEGLAIDGVEDSYADATLEALSALYTGIDHPIGVQTALALDAITTAETISASSTSAGVVYPEGNFGDALASLAQLIKAQVGVRVACVDVGGWDTHTGMGTITDGDMKRHLGDLATALDAFTRDIGSNLDSTTIVTMSEFGRRVEQNASGGTDHGHGGAVLVIGGGVNSGVHGRWEGLSAGVLDPDNGDVPGWNDYRDVLTEVVTSRLGLSGGDMATVFPSWSPTPVGVMS